MTTLVGSAVSLAFHRDSYKRSPYCIKVWSTKKCSSILYSSKYMPSIYYLNLKSLYFEKTKNRFQ